MAQNKKSPLYTLYESLKSDNYDVPDTYESFERTLTAPGNEGTTNRMTLYNSLRTDNYDVPDSYESFANTLFTPAPIQQQPDTTAEQSTSGISKAATRVMSYAMNNSDNTDGDSNESAWQPSEQEKIRKMHSLHQMRNDAESKMKSAVDNTSRIVESRTPQGKRREAVAHTTAQVLGLPTRLLGTTATPYRQTADGSNDEQPEAGVLNSPKEYGVVIDADGNPRQQWLMPDGSTTTDLLLVDNTERAARESRMEYRRQQLPVRIAEAEAEAEAIEKAIDERKKVLDAENSSFSKDHPVLNFFRDASDSHSPVTSMNSAVSYDDRYRTDKEYLMLEAALAQNKKARQLLYDARDGNTNDFWHSMATGFEAGEFSMGERSYDTAIARQAARNNMDSSATRLFLSADARHGEISSLFEDQYGVWARVGRMGVSSLDFMKDMFLLGGGPLSIAKGTTGATIKGGTKLIGKKAAETAFGKYALKATGIFTGSMAGGTLVANTTGFNHTLSDAFENASGQSVENENGDFEIIDGVSLGRAIWDAERDNAVENATELVGGLIPGGVLIKTLDKFGLKKYRILPEMLPERNGMGLTIKCWSRQDSMVFHQRLWKNMPVCFIARYSVTLQTNGMHYLM